MKYRKKPVIIEAITFDEFVEYGKANGGNIVNNMPWSFQYKGHSISHENDNCYLINTLEGTMKFTPKDMLITGVNGEVYPCKIDIFEVTYEKVMKETNVIQMSKSEIDKIKAVLSDLKNSDIEDYVLNLTKALEIAVDEMSSFIETHKRLGDNQTRQLYRSEIYKSFNESLKQISEILETK